MGPLTIAFYISGHGYGHSTRMIEVIRELFKHRPDVFCHIKTDAPRWLFDMDLSGPYASRYVYHPCAIDVATVQADSFSVDRLATLRKARQFFENAPGRVAAEADFLQRHNVRLLIGDIPPLSFEIAAAAGVPSLAVANFSWDWIYKPYAEALPEFHGIIERIRNAYGKADLLLRLPLFGDLSAFRRREDIPFIARKAEGDREKVFRDLNLPWPTEKKLVLVAFRPGDLAKVNLAPLGGLDDVLFVFFSLQPALKNAYTLPPVRYPFKELVAASDAVISKPGYGIVSECIANRTPLLYTPREDFIEYDVLVAGLNEYAVSRALRLDDFFSGNWEPQLRTLFSTPRHWKPVAIDGAAIAAEMILQYPLGP